MDDVTHQFRLSRTDLVEFIASETKQREFAGDVAYANYADEFYEWWFEDWHPESPLFKKAFTSKEIEILEVFTKTWQTFDADLGENLSIDDLLANTTWAQIMGQAKLTLSALNNAT